MLLLRFPVFRSSNSILPEPNNTAFWHSCGGFVRHLCVFESSLEFSPSNRSHSILIKHGPGLVLQPLHNWLQAGEIRAAAICIKIMYKFDIRDLLQTFTSKKTCIWVRLAVAPNGPTPTDTDLLTLAVQGSSNVTLNVLPYTKKPTSFKWGFFFFEREINTL